MPDHARFTVSGPVRLAPRVIVNTIGTWPCSAPLKVVPARAIVGLASSLTMVPVPVPVAIVAPDGLDRMTVNVSFAS